MNILEESAFKCDGEWQRLPLCFFDEDLPDVEPIELDDVVEAECQCCGGTYIEGYCTDCAETVLEYHVNCLKLVTEDNIRLRREVATLRGALFIAKATWH